MSESKKESIERLRNAFNDKNLTLYLGAGVSMKNNLPSWDKLVLSMYFNKISEQHLNGRRPFSNYLFAISEWHLSHSTEPLDITARKLKKYYKEGHWEKEFLLDLHRTLYGSYLNRNGDISVDMSDGLLRGNNSTLDAVAYLCESNHKGIKSVITYNYDNFLEIAIGLTAYQSIYVSTSLDPGKLPIYHVHGFVPIDKNNNGSSGSEIIFTEDQYHLVARNPYHWSTLVQLQAMTDNVSLMIGLSLSDRNLRRLLDAVSNAPVNSINYAILMVPDTKSPDDHTLDEIHEKAINYLDQFGNSGIKSDQDPYGEVLFSRPGIKSDLPDIFSNSGRKGPRYQHEIAGIIEQVKLQDRDQQQYVLEQLGVAPIWIDDFAEIPEILKQVHQLP